MTMLRQGVLVVLGLGASAFAGSSAVAKVATITLAELAHEADFIGVVRVERVSIGIPLLKRPRAKATILESWKGQASGSVTFVAAPTWICDISDAKKGEEAIVFIRGRRLEHAGRGRMPIFTRRGRRLAAFWNDVRLPSALETERGPEPEYGFIRGASVAALREAIATLASGASHEELDTSG